MRLFEDLTGYRDNLAKEHRKIAEGYTRSILSELKEAVGVVLLGGAARGYSDMLSEIDLAIFLTHDVRKLPKGEHWWRGYLLDNDLYVYDRELATDWSQEKRQAFSEGKILFDKKRLVQSLLRSKLKYTTSDRRRIILENLLFLEDRIESAKTVWPKRSHIPSAHYAVTMGVEHLLKVLFAYNRQFLPSDKWRFYYSCHLPWLPRSYQKILTEIMKVKGVTDADVQRRVAKLASLDLAVRRKLRKENMLPEDVYRYCVERIWSQPAIATEQIERSHKTRRRTKRNLSPKPFFQEQRTTF